MINIDRIEIEGFRGITGACSLSLDGKSLLLFGENGTGKSSFVDGIERLFTGKVSTLEGRMGVSTDRHGPNIRTTGSAKISVHFSEGSQFNLESNVQLLSPLVKKYLVAAQQPLYILRRCRILDLIEKRPQECYELLRPFLPLTEVEQVETALREAFQKANKEVAEAERALNTVSKELTKAAGIGEQVPVDEKQVCDALSKRLQAIGIIKLRNLSELGKAISVLETRLAGSGDMERLITLHSARSLLRELQSSLTALDFTNFRSALQVLCSRQEAVGGTFFEDVLQRGLEWIGTDWQGRCPLCETPWDKKPRDRDALVARIESRLHEMTEVVRSRQDADRVRQELLKILRRVQDSCRQLRTTLEILGELDGLRQLDEVIGSLQNLCTLLDQRPDQITVDGLDAAIASWRTAAYPTRLQELMEKVDAAAIALPSLGEIRSLSELRSLLSRIGELWERETEARTKHNLVDRRAQVASTMLRLLEEARKEVLQGIFDQISQDLDDLFNKVTGGTSGLTNLRLKIRPEVRGSITYGSDFYDQRGVVPYAYGSDGQLDMIGLCTFLALRRWYRKQHPDFNLLILDDVLTSIDTQHAARTAELILKEFGDYQTLLTTHDRIWYEYLRDIQARCRVKGKFLNKVIHKWTIEEGPDLREPEEEHERLKQLLVAGEASQIAVEAGRLLEHILQEMRYSLRLSVQAKRGELYEIGEIWPAFYSALRKIYSGCYEKFGGTLDSLDIRWPVRNWVGAHFNRWASRVSKEEVLEFSHAVSKLFEGMFCKHCRRFVEPSMTPAGQLSCRCGQLIYPVPGKEPSKPLPRKELVKMTRGAFRDARLNTKLYLKWKRAEMGREDN